LAGFQATSRTLVFGSVGPVAQSDSEPAAQHAQAIAVAAAQHQAARRWTFGRESDSAKPQPAKASKGRRTVAAGSLGPDADTVYARGKEQSRAADPA
jgi:hypothetical protein